MFGKCSMRIFGCNTAAEIIGFWVDALLEAVIQDDVDSGASVLYITLHLRGKAMNR
jgi:hypothetical protein